LSALLEGEVTALVEAVALALACPSSPCRSLTLVSSTSMVSIPVSIGMRNMRYRLVSPEEAGDNSEIELGIPRGAAGSSSVDSTRLPHRGRLV
jgi:hypothetical protein